MLAGLPVLRSLLQLLQQNYSRQMLRYKLLRQLQKNSDWRLPEGTETSCELPVRLRKLLQPLQWSLCG